MISLNMTVLDTTQILNITLQQKINFKNKIFCR